MAAKTIFRDILAGKMRKKCAVRAIPTTHHKWTDGVLSLSTMFSVGI